MADFTVKADVRDVLRGFDALKDKSGRLSKAFNELKKDVREDQRDHQKSKQGPDGGWPALSPATLGRDRFKRARGAIDRKTKERKTVTRKGRRRTGRSNILGKIPKALLIRSSSKNVTAMARAQYAGIHQEGGRVGRGAEIPARPFLWVSETLVKIAEAKLAKHILKVW